MKTYRSLIVSTLTVITLATAAQAQQLPSHGAAAAGKTPTIVEPATLPGTTYSAWVQDLGLDILYGPSPDDDRFKDSLGLGLSYTIPFPRSLALRLHAAYETLNGERGFDDADIIPIGFSFMAGLPTEGPVRVGLELGLRYSFVDYEDAGGKYDDAFNGFAGLQLATQSTSGFDVEFGVGYRFDISESSNDRSTELSLEGIQLRLSLRLAL